VARSKAGAQGVAPARRAKDGPRGAAPASRFKDAAQGAPARVEFELRGEHIALDALLKATGLAESGGAAKQAITSGTVRVDGAVELRRGCKLRAGQVVEAEGAWIRIVASGGFPEGRTVSERGA
jgi:ribosome-associated protein